jgi:hypothetical protein
VRVFEGTGTGGVPLPASGKRSGALWTALAALQSGQSTQSAKVVAALAGSEHPLSERPALLSEWSDGFAKHVACLEKQPYHFRMLLNFLFSLVNGGTIFYLLYLIFNNKARIKLYDDDGEQIEL